MPESLWQRRSPGRSTRALVFLAAVLCVMLLVSSVRADGANVGIYTELTGNTCSFSGDTPGLVTAFVVFRPDANGLTGIQFAAPLPSCFAATYISESVPVELLSIGNSQTGISI